MTNDIRAKYQEEAEALVVLATEAFKGMHYDYLRGEITKALQAAHAEGARVEVTEDMVERGARAIFDAERALQEAGKVSDEEWERLKMKPGNLSGTYNEYMRSTWKAKNCLKAALGNSHE